MTNLEFKAAILPQIDQALLNIESRDFEPGTHVTFNVPTGTYKVEANKARLLKFRAKIEKLPAEVGDYRGVIPSSRIRRLTPTQKSAANKRIRDCIDEN